jgi:hypothetical protein
LAKTGQRENKSGDTVELETGETWQWQHHERVFPLYSPTERNSHPNRLRWGLAERSGGGHIGLDTGRPVRSQRRDRGRGKRDGGAMLWRRTIVALKRMGSNGLKI